MVRAQTRTDDDARGSHLSIPGIRIFRMNGLHRCVNNNANRFHWCVRADSKPPVSDVCLRSMDSMPVASTTIPSTRRKRRSNGDICYRCLCFSFSFFFFLERSVIVNLLVWIEVMFVDYRNWEIVLLSNWEIYRKVILKRLCLLKLKWSELSSKVVLF